MPNPVTFGASQALLTFAGAAPGAVGASAKQGNTIHRGVKVFINITAIVTGNLTITIRGYDPVSGTSYNILASAALAAPGFTVLSVYPGIAAAANVAANDNLPDTWDINAALTAGTVSATVSISKLA